MSNDRANVIDNEVPTEGEVLSALGDLGGSIDATQLMEALVKKGHDRYDSQRAIQRALDRGSVVLGTKMRLELVDALQAA